jgi:hypothetical protein
MNTKSHRPVASLHRWIVERASPRGNLPDSTIQRFNDSTVALCLYRSAVLLLSAMLLTGCHDHSQHGHSHGGHAHAAPHGGTLVELGDHEYNLELVLDAAAGKLKAYVLDGHAENFVRIQADAFTVKAKVSDREETLEFRAVANEATGETVGDTSVFEVQADWLKDTPAFDGVLQQLLVKGRVYQLIKFQFTQSK